jgi:hypothetical protein
MGDIPALDRVLAQLTNTLKADETFDGWTVEADRAVDDDLARGELPHLNILHRGTDYQQLTHAETVNRAEVDLEFTVPAKAAAPIGKRLRLIEAQLITTLFANRTLGGYVQDIQPQGSSGADEQRAETGTRTLSVLILFITPVGDQFTLVGTNGLIP